MLINRLSCCTYPLIQKDPDYVFAVAAAAGYKKVDLLGRMPHFDILDPAYDFDAVMAAAQKHGIRIGNIGSYIGGDFVSEDAAVRDKALENAKKVLDAAKRCGARSVRSVMGRPESPDMLARILPYYQRMAEYAEKVDVYMGVENHGGSVSGNPQMLAWFFDKVGSKYAGVLYEPCNLMIAGVEYKKAFDTMKEHITHVHVKDCYVVNGKMTSVWLGTGVIDYRWVLQALDGIGYDGDLALEYEMEVEPAETAVGKWLDHFQKFAS